MTPVRLEYAAPRSRVKHSTTEPLRSHIACVFILQITKVASFLEFIYGGMQINFTVRTSKSFNSPLTSCDFCCLPITFANSLLPDQDWQYVLIWIQNVCHSIFAFYNSFFFFAIWSYGSPLTQTIDAIQTIDALVLMIWYVTWNVSQFCLWNNTNCSLWMSRTILYYTLLHKICAAQF